MARLDPKPYPVEKRWADKVPGMQHSMRWTVDDLVAHDEAVWKKLEALTANLPAGEVVGGVVTFPVADGRAIYVVTKARPLTLQHVPLGDAYAIPAAYLRGLTLRDVRVNIERARRIHDLFANAKPLKVGP